MEPLSLHVEALRQDPTSESAAAKIRAGARAQGDLKTYVQVFAERGRQLEQRGLGDRAAASYLEAAMVAEELADWVGAAELYRQAFISDPTKREPLTLLERAFVNSGRPRDLVPMLRDLIGKTRDPSARAEVHLHLADFLANQLNDPSAAVEEIKAALAIDGTNPTTLSRARAGLTVRGSAQTFVHLLEDQLKARPAGSAPAIEQELARVRGTDKSPTPPPARSHPSVSPPPNAPPVQGRPSAPGASPPAPRVSISAPPPPPAPAAVPAPAPPPAMLTGTAQTAQADPKTAITLLSRALMASPANVGLVDELDRLGRLVEDALPVAQAYEEAIKRCTDPTIRGHIRLKLGALYDQVLDRPEEAVAVYATILEENPKNVEVRKLLVAREGPEEDAAPDSEEKLIAGLEEAAPSPPPNATSDVSRPTESHDDGGGATVLPNKSAVTATASDTAPAATNAMAPTEAFEPSQVAPRKLPVVPIALGAAAVLAAGIGAVAMFTEAMWPEVRISSSPSGASVLLDDVLQPDKTPVVLRVEPNVPHRIELRYPNASPIQIPKELKLARRETHSFSMRFEAPKRLVRIEPVEATVEVDGKVAGTGSTVELRGLPLEEPVRLRISAPGYAPVEQSFAKGSEVPETLIIQLAPLPK